MSVLRGAVVRPVARVLPSWMTPNALSGIRLLLAGGIALLLLGGKPAVAVALYVLAAATDALDGELARLRARETRLGARLDPAVDKVLHGVVFLAFFPVEPVLISVVLALDAVLFIVGSILTLRQGTRRVSVSASVFGKWKLLFQTCASLVLFWNSIVLSSFVPSAILKLIFVLAIAFATCSLFGYARRFFSLDQGTT